MERGRGGDPESGSRETDDHRADRDRHLRDVELYEPAGESTGVGAWRIDLPTHTLHVSEEVLRIRGLPPDYDLSLEEGIRFYHPEDRPVMRAAVDRLETVGTTYDLELREVTEDGEVYWVRTTGVAEYDEDGAVVALRGVYRDITDRKDRERELQRHVREIRRQNERLERFAGVLSHDLRTPLTVAQGRLALARDRPRAEHFDAIDRALDRIDAVIADVLDLARRGDPVVDPEPVDLGALATSCWEAVGGDDERLVLETDATVLCDRDRLRRLLGNLLRNALEHAGEAVTVTVGDLDDGFYVEDDGPGIPADERAAALEFGYSTSPTGTGFGLPIVTEVAEAHHWQVRVDEGTDGGARFEFRDVPAA